MNVWSIQRQVMNNCLSTSPTAFHPVQHSSFPAQIDPASPAQSTSSSSSQERSEVPTHYAPSDLSDSEVARSPLDKPSYAEVLEAVKRSRESKNNPTEELAHLLEHFNKDWLFKLYHSTRCPQLRTILAQKIEIRLKFEATLKQLSNLAPTDERPTCFICFAFEDDVTPWLESVFVPDLELVDVEPVVCFKQFGPGKNLDAFQARIQETDKVVIVCTPLLRELCNERKENPTGSAMEVHLAVERFTKKKELNTIEKDENGTIFLVHLKGERERVVPHFLFNPILGTDLNKDGKLVWSYYSHAFELFGAIRGIDRQNARSIKRIFFKHVGTILEQDFKDHHLETRNEHHDSVTKKRIKGISENMVRRMRKMCLPKHPTNFCGRIKELRELKDSYNSGTRHVAIIGPSGIGKSGLALVFAHQSKELFESIYTIRVSEHSSLRQGLLKLADELNFQGTEDERLSTLKNWLKEFDHKHLILLDNVDDVDLFEELKPFIDSLGDCCLLITSVNMNRSEKLGFKLFKLAPLRPEDAASFMLNANPQTNEEGAKNLVLALHFFPRALIGAADYMQAQSCSSDAFLRRYKREGTKLLTLSSSPNTRTHLIPWRDHLKKIEMKMNGETHAAQILVFFSVIPEKIVSREKLETWAEHRGFGINFDHALRWLLDYALIDSPTVDNYALHPFVSTEVIECLQIATRRKFCLYAMNFEERIYFAENDGMLDKSSQRVDIPIETESELPITSAKKLLSTDKFLHLSIEGHAENTGSVASTKKASEERAQYVKRLIVQDDPTFENRTNCIGVGSTKSLDVSTDPAAERNRVAIIRIDIERSMEIEDLFFVDDLASLLNGEECVTTFTQRQELQNLVIEAVKIKLYMHHFVQYVFFDDHAEHVESAKIVRILAATTGLLRKCAFIHLAIEGHARKAGNVQEDPNIGIRRAEYLKDLIVKSSGDPDKVAKRINVTSVEAKKPLDISLKPTLKRNCVAIIRIDIEKSTAPYLSALHYNFSYRESENSCQSELND